MAEKTDMERWQEVLDLTPSIYSTFLKKGKAEIDDLKITVTFDKSSEELHEAYMALSSPEDAAFINEFIKKAFDEPMILEIVEA